MTLTESDEVRRFVMGDLCCPTCGEPWDAYHLRFDAVWETDLSEHAKKIYSDGGCKPFTKEIRSALERDGWSFPEGATSVMSFIRCPSCPEDAKTDKDKAELRSVLTEVLGDDEDAIQCELEDLENL